MATKYGRQPFLDLIAAGGNSYEDMAAELGIPYLHLRNAGYGYAPPSAELVEKLVVRFRVGVEELFTEAALASNSQDQPGGTKYGRQPFLDLVKEEGLTYRKAAAELKVPYLHFRHVGYGYVTPKDELREALVERFNRPLEELLTEESVASVPHYGEKGRRLMAEAQAMSESTI